MLTVRHMTLDDVEAVISIHKEAFAGSAGLSVGDSYLHAIINWFIEYSDAIVIVCEKDGQVVGYIYGAIQHYGQSLNRDLLGIIIAAVVTHPLSIFNYNLLRQIPSRLHNILARYSKPSDKATQGKQLIYKLVAIGVKSSARGQGVGRIMIYEFEKIAWKKNADEIQLSVYPNNNVARHLYESCGWRVLINRHNLVIYGKRNCKEPLSPQIA